MIKKTSIKTKTFGQMPQADNSDNTDKKNGHKKVEAKITTKLKPLGRKTITDESKKIDKPLAIYFNEDELELFEDHLWSVIEAGYAKDTTAAKKIILHALHHDYTEVKEKMDNKNLTKAALYAFDRD